MAKLSKIAQAKRKPKFKVRAYKRCPLCGRNRALRGEITGVTKSSW